MPKRLYVVPVTEVVQAFYEIWARDKEEAEELAEHQAYSRRYEAALDERTVADVLQARLVNDEDA